MNRTEFISELEYLLQDISQEEKEEAVSYYKDYLEEAGDEHEAQAIREFGSPERVAAIIRSDLAGALEDGGSFTESGYQDERFKEPNYQVVTHRSLPDVTEGVNPEDTIGKKSSKQMDPLWVRILKVCGLFLLLAVLVGILPGIVGVLLVIVVGIGALTLAVCAAAVVLFVLGLGMIIAQSWWSGILMIGTGILVMGIAFFGIAISILVYGTFLPYCIRGGVHGLGKLFHGRGGRGL